MGQSQAADHVGYRRFGQAADDPGRPEGLFGGDFVTETSGPDSAKKDETSVSKKGFTAQIKTGQGSAHA